MLDIQVEPWPHSVGNELRLKLDKWGITQGRVEPESPKQNSVFGKEEAAAQRSSEPDTVVPATARKKAGPIDSRG